MEKTFVDRAEFCDADLQEMERLRYAVETADLPETIWQLLERCAESFGDRTAAVWFEENTALTYRELSIAANTFAASMITRGIRKGHHVAVMLPNSPAFLICWFGLARIGAVMVPVNTAYTPTEAAFVVKDSDAVALFVHDELKASVPEILTHAVTDDLVFVVGAESLEGTGYQAWDALFADVVEDFNPGYPVKRDDLCNIQYTSGSTGFPKGCMLTHDYWLIAGKTMSTARGRDATTQPNRVLIWAPLYYLDPLWQIVTTFYLEGTAYIARRMQLSKFISWIEDNKIDTTWAFPEVLTKDPEFLSKGKDFPLRYTTISMWTPEARVRFQKQVSAMARECFGMTEVGLNLIVPAAAGQYAFSRSCGLPGPFRDHMIMNEEGNEVSPGQEGELWISGRSIMLGYYKKPRANAETFRGKWLRSGDKFIRDERGYHFVVGRIKEMIKRSGENIAAIEVESVLRTMEDIAEAAVVAVPDPLRREEVKAYVRLRDGLTHADVTPEQIIQHCSSRLARFKIPRYIAYVEEFPRTPSRKIAKAKLVGASNDLREGAFDLVEGIWR